MVPFLFLPARESGGARSAVVGGEHANYSYNGSLLTGVTWSGEVAAHPRADFPLALNTKGSTPQLVGDPFEHDADEGGKFGASGKAGVKINFPLF